jgi:hypothetical protein
LNILETKILMSSGGAFMVLIANCSISLTDTQALGQRPLFGQERWM